MSSPSCSRVWSASHTRPAHSTFVPGRRSSHTKASGCSTPRPKKAAPSTLPCAFPPSLWTPCTAIPNEHSTARGRCLRVAEWIQLIFVTLLALGAFARPLANSRRLRVIGLAIVAVAAILAARFSDRWISPLASSVLRDWLPAALLLVPYWQVGQFFTAPDGSMEERLAAFDRRFFTVLGIAPERINLGAAFAAYFQFAYVMVYPLIPLGLVALYTLHLRSHLDDCWRV